jgi:hypothetical protein
MAERDGSCGWKRGLHETNGDSGHLDLLRLSPLASGAGLTNRTEPNRQLTSVLGDAKKGAGLFKVS